MLNLKISNGTLSYKKYQNSRAMNSNTTSNSIHVIYLLSNTWKSFWKRTDISGMTNAREAQSGLRKKIWIVLSIVFFILTIAAMYQVLHEYTHYPVTTSIKVKYQNQVAEIYIDKNDTVFYK